MKPALNSTRRTSRSPLRRSYSRLWILLLAPKWRLEASSPIARVEATLVARRAIAARLAAGHLAGAHLVLVVARLAGEAVLVLVDVHRAGEAVLVLVVELPAGEETAAAQLTAVEEMGHELPTVVVLVPRQHMAAQLPTVALPPMVERQHTVATMETAPHMVGSALEAAPLDGEDHQETPRDQVVCPLLHQAHTMLQHQVPMPLPRLEAMAHTLHLHLEARLRTHLRLVTTLRQPQEPPLP
jgi:hypothetical protein